MGIKCKKIIIFDLDGTLYNFKGGSLKSSGLYDVIIENTAIYISSKLKKTKLEAREILNFVLEKYGDSISIGLEKEFRINRYEYFNFVWDIDVKKYVKIDSAIRPLILELQKNFNLVLLSDAPMIWIDSVLDYLEIKKLFKGNIFSGEGDTRKEFGNAFEKICKTMNIETGDCFIVGDQEETDIIPAKKMGMKTIFIGKNKSNVADYIIDNILKLKNVLKIYG
ncbi:MAG: HAD family hydrolase [bacterium]|nr:HAD family hydrolase [bacterium]